MRTHFPFEDYEFQPRARCYVAAAILGAGALSAGAGIYGATTAADAQTSNSQAALAQQKAMFEQAKGYLLPYIQAGQGGIAGLQNFVDPNSSSSPLNALLKLLMPGSNQSETLAQTPGYQFAEDRGLRSVNNALAARGLAGSGGAVAKGASEFTTGLAQNTWSSVVDRLLATLGGGTNALSSLVNTGANSAGNLAGGAISSGKDQASTQIGIGNAQAAGANAIGGAVGGLGNSLSTAALIKQLTGSGAAPATGIYSGDSLTAAPQTGTGWGNNEF